MSDLYHLYKLMHEIQHNLVRKKPRLKPLSLELPKQLKRVEEQLFSEEKDRLLEKYRIVHCAEEEESIIPREAIIGKRKHEFGTEMLCLRERIAEEIPTDPATIEDIMLYYIKECAE